MDSLRAAALALQSHSKKTSSVSSRGVRLDAFSGCDVPIQQHEHVGVVAQIEQHAVRQDVGYVRHRLGTAHALSDLASHAGIVVALLKIREIVADPADSPGDGAPVSHRPLHRLQNPVDLRPPRQAPAGTLIRCRRPRRPAIADCAARRFCGRPPRPSGPASAPARDRAVSGELAHHGHARARAGRIQAGAPAPPASPRSRFAWPAPTRNRRACGSASAPGSGGAGWIPRSR